MDGSAVRDALAVDEAGLARAAAAGDGGAFGALYRRYEGRVFNLAYRISGSEEIAVEAVQRAFRGVMRSGSLPAERELAFGSYLLMETRNASHDPMRGREPAVSSAAPGRSRATRSPVDSARRTFLTGHHSSGFCRET